MERKVAKVKPKKKDKSLKDTKTLQDIVDLADEAVNNTDSDELVKFMCQFIYGHLVKAAFVGNDVVAYTDDGKVFIISVMAPKPSDDEMKEIKEN